MVDNAHELLDAYAFELSGRHYVQHEIKTMVEVDRESCAPKAFAALRAVLDLHKPTPDGHHCEECVRVQACCYDDVTAEASWPCGTVDAITAAL